MRHLLKKGKISKLFSDNKTGGMSREAYLIKYHGKKYVLRKCRTGERADAFEEVAKKFEKYGFLPKYLGRYRNSLFFEYLEGRDLTNKDVKYAEQVGKIYGYVNREKSENTKKFDFHSNFYERLDFLLKKKVVSKEDYIKISRKFEELSKKVKLKFGFDMGDITPDNFRLSRRKIYYVDMEGVNDNTLIGVGFGKSFLKWFKTKKQRINFLKGYNSAYSSKYLTRDYLQFIYLFFLIKNTASKIRNKLGYSTNLNKLEKFLKGKLE